MPACAAAHHPPKTAKGAQGAAGTQAPACLRVGRTNVGGVQAAQGCAGCRREVQRAEDLATILSAVVVRRQRLHVRNHLHPNELGSPYSMGHHSCSGECHLNLGQGRRQENSSETNDLTSDPQDDFLTRNGNGFKDSEYTSPVYNAFLAYTSSQSPCLYDHLILRLQLCPLENCRYSCTLDSRPKPA